jgi:hypothetical protein
LGAEPPQQPCPQTKEKPSTDHLDTDLRIARASLMGRSVLLPRGAEAAVALPAAKAIGGLPQTPDCRASAPSRLRGKAFLGVRSDHQARPSKRQKYGKRKGSAQHVNRCGPPTDMGGRGAGPERARPIGVRLSLHPGTKLLWPRFPVSHPGRRKWKPAERLVGRPVGRLTMGGSGRVSESERRGSRPRTPEPPPRKVGLIRAWFTGQTSRLS